VAAEELEVGDLDVGVFGAYSEFTLDPDLDPSLLAMSTMEEGMVGASDVPPEEAVEYEVSIGSHSLETDPYKLPKRDEPAAIADEGDIRWMDEMWRLDPRLRKLDAQMIPPTPVNLEWVFWREPTCRAMATTIFATIVGDGPQIVTRNKKIQEALDRYNKDTMIVDVIRDLVFDNIIHGESLFIKRIVKIGDEERLRIFRIDMRTVRRIQHDFEGWTKWKQYAFVRASLPDKKKEFEEPGYDPMPMVDPNFVIRRGEKGMVHITQMLDNEVLFFNLFRESPLMAILDLAVHKRWIIIFMRKSAMRFSTPIPIVTVGSELHHPSSVDNYKKILSNASKRASRWRNFDAWAVPFHWKVQMEQPRDSGSTMIGMLEFLNKEIMLALSGSISLFQNVGNALSTGGKSIAENFLRIVRGMRTKIGYVLEKLYREVLIFEEGFTEEELEKEANKFEVDWTELSDESQKEYVETILGMHNAGLMKDKIETRELLRKQVPGLEDIDDEAELTMDAADVVQDTRVLDIPGDEDFDTAGPGD